MDWNRVLPTTGPRIIAGIFTLIAALGALLAGVASHYYEEGKDVGAKDLEVYKTANALNLPTLSKNLAGISGDLVRTFNVYEENKKLQDRATAQEARVAALTKERDDDLSQLTGVRSELEKAKQSQQEEVAQLQAELAKFKGKSRHFVIARNYSEELPGGDRIGITYVSNNNANATFHNQSITVTAGTMLDVSTPPFACHLAVTKIVEWERVEFDLNCLQ